MSARMLRVLVATAALVMSACDSADHPAAGRMKDRLASVFNAADKNPTPDELRVALDRQLRSARLPEAGSAPAADAPFPSRRTLETFYDKQGGRMVWTDANGKLRPVATSLVSALGRASEHGLNPEDYAAGRLDSLAKEIAGGSGGDKAATRLADFDLLATTAFFRYASDLSTGRVHPDEVENDWHTNPPELDLVPALDSALAGGDLATLLASLPPPHPGYERLRAGLAKLRGVEQAGGWPAIPDGPKLKRGAGGPRVAALRQRLDAGTAPATTDRFDEALQSAVKAFQEQHGLTPDGIVDDKTLAAMNVPVTDRIRQVELNLERWRWIPRNLGETHVLVNIPGFDLELDKGDSTAWRTRVVTGKAFTPTPVFSDRIVGVVVNPPWNVPESIAVNELLPDLRKNPNAAAKQGLRLLKGSEEKPEEIDPKTVDWSKVDAEHFPYRFRQEPGESNPLGRIKFALTNGFHVYLHDTPAGNVFGRSERDVSHGCIRVENAQELADQITTTPDREKIHEALEQSDERHIELDAKIPVHILYWTAWADEHGNLHFGPDIYDFDPPQRAALDRAGERGATAVSPTADLRKKTGPGA
jgi:murein L,D-transpeptidase YcbB/YkuD